MERDVPRPWPPLTLDHIREGGRQSRRLVLAARQHVGEAGLEQAAALERIIAAGREQTQLNHALRQLLTTLSGAQGEDVEGLRVAGYEQLAGALDLQKLVADALRKVASTPVEQISVEALEDIRCSVEEQITALEGLLNHAREQLDPGQEAALANIQHGVESATQQIRRDEATGEVESLGVLSRDAVNRIASLDAAPTEQQVAMLREVAQQAAEQAAALEQGDQGQR